MCYVYILPNSGLSFVSLWRIEGRCITKKTRPSVCVYWKGSESMAKSTAEKSTAEFEMQHS